MSPSDTKETKPSSIRDVRDVIGVRIEKNEVVLVMDAIKKELINLSRNPSLNDRYRILKDIFQKMDDAWTNHLKNSTDVGFGE